MKEPINFDQIVIKKIKRQTLTAVQRNSLFNEITSKSCSQATYNVNGKTCLGLSFDNIDEETRSRIESFCKKTLLDIASITIPWNEKITVIFIRPAVSNWRASCLKNITREDLKA